MVPIRLALVSAVALMVSCPPPSAGPIEPTAPTDETVALWAGEQSWDVDDFALPQLRMAWVRTCLADVPPTCTDMCDLRTVHGPIESASVPERFRFVGHRLVRSASGEAASEPEVCDAYAPQWQSSWHGPWRGPIASTWQVTTDARTGTELSSERGSPMRRRMRQPAAP